MVELIKVDVEMVELIRVEMENCVVGFLETWFANIAHNGLELSDTC